MKRYFMLQPDPTKKVNLDQSNDYDKDGKVTNEEYPVREGSGEDSILSDKGPKGDAAYDKLKENDNQPREQEEYIDMKNDEKAES